MEDKGEPGDFGKWKSLQRVQLCWGEVQGAVISARSGRVETVPFGRRTTFDGAGLQQ